MIRAVLDPGVLISAVVSPSGTCARLIRRWHAGEFDLIVSEKLLGELSMVLRRPKFRRFVSEADVDEIETVLRRRAVLVEDPDHIEPVCRDPGDDYLIALARAARADVLVSGDADLTALRILLTILSPRAFTDGLNRRA